MMVKTYSQFLDAVQQCQTEDEARELVRREVNEVLTHRPSLLDEEAREIVMQNIGYMTGYLDRAEAARTLKLFGARHPVFGAIEDWPKTAEETVEIGFKIGMRVKNGERR